MTGPREAVAAANCFLDHMNGSRTTSRLGRSIRRARKGKPVRDREMADRAGMVGERKYRLGSLLIACD